MYIDSSHIGGAITKIVHCFSSGYYITGPWPFEFVSKGL